MYIVAFLKEVFGLDISQGSMVNWVNAAKASAEPAIAAIEQYIRRSSVVGFDESGLYCNKRLDWTWIAQTTYFTLLFRASGRAAKELDSRFGDSLERMVAVTDRHSAYFALNFLDHQVCLAHLLMELQYLNELDKRQDWSARVEQLLQQAIHSRNEHPQEVIDKSPWLKRLDPLLTENVSHMNQALAKLQKGLTKCRDYIFNFLENPACHPSRQQCQRAGNQKGQNQNEKLRHLPFRPRCRRIPRNTLDCRDCQKARQAHLRCHPRSILSVGTRSTPIAE